MVEENTETRAKAKGQKPSRAEWLLAIAAGVIICGWIISWIQYRFDLFGGWFRPLSFFGALVVLAFVVQKPFGLIKLPEKLENRILPIVSLLPVLGFVISAIDSLIGFLTIGGSLVLAYLSATTYWRKQFVRLASTSFTGTSGDATPSATPLPSGDAPSASAPATPPTPPPTPATPPAPESPPPAPEASEEKPPESGSGN